MRRPFPNARIDPDRIQADSLGPAHVDVQAVSNKECFVGGNTHLFQCGFEDGRVGLSPAECVRHDDAFEHLSNGMLLQACVKRWRVVEVGYHRQSIAGNTCPMQKLKACGANFQSRCEEFHVCFGQPSGEVRGIAGGIFTENLEQDSKPVLAPDLLEVRVAPAVGFGGAFKECLYKIFESKFSHLFRIDFIYPRCGCVSGGFTDLVFGKPPLLDVNDRIESVEYQS